MRERAVDLARGKWASVLSTLGIPADVLNPRKHFRCPKDGSGIDRFRFADNNGSGSYFCACSTGDKGGMSLLMCCMGWTYAEAAIEVEKIVGIATPSEVQERPDPMPRLKAVQAACSNPGSCVMEYLASRGLEPSAATKQATVTYYDDGKNVGDFECMVHKVTAADGSPLTFHVTYLADGKKADVPTARKVLPAIAPLHGAAIRLKKEAAEMGVAEGVETALAASAMFNLPVWSVINTTLMEKFDPPEICTRLWIFGDSDKSFAGQKSAYSLAERLSRKGLEVHVLIPATNGDWNDVLLGIGESEAERNRRNFPGMAKMLDQFKAANPRAIWAEENGRSIGRNP